MSAGSSRIVVIAVTSVVFLIGTPCVRAQAPGRAGPPPTAPGQAKKATTSRNLPTTPNQLLSEPSKRVQTLGSWLDTADVNAPGETWMWVSTAYWRSRAQREINAPAMGLSVGVARRAQLSVSVPYCFLTEPSGSTSRGFGAWYVTPKFAVTRNHRVNVSTSPTLEILNWSSSDIRRVNFLLPVSAEAYAGPFRVYGSTGYVSRGSVFGSGALEWSARDSLTFTTSIAHSYSVVPDPTSDTLGIPRHTTDASAGLYLSLRQTVVLFASVGRTFTPVNQTSGRLALSSGVTLNVARRGTNVPRTQ
jgi:hypothetical protein